MDFEKDYYAVLGILPSAEDIVIRAAYKALVQRYHPDRFVGSPEEAYRRTAALNEAYAILSDSAQKAAYDAARGSRTQSAEWFFNDGQEGAPQDNDPLERDWKIASSFYRDILDIEDQLRAVSWRLAYSFRAYLLAEKAFEKRHRVADEMLRQFFITYFGDNAVIVKFARALIDGGHKSAARALNEAVRVLGSDVDPNRIIQKIVDDCKLVDVSGIRNRRSVTPQENVVVKSCPSCRAMNTDESSVCKRCGSALPE